MHRGSTDRHASGAVDEAIEQRGRHRIGSGRIVEQPEGGGDEAALAHLATGDGGGRLRDPADDDAGIDQPFLFEGAEAGEHVARHDAIEGNIEQRAAGGAFIRDIGRQHELEGQVAAFWPLLGKRVELGPAIGCPAEGRKLELGHPVLVAIVVVPGEVFAAGCNQRFLPAGTDEAAVGAEQ